MMITYNSTNQELVWLCNSKPWMITCFFKEFSYFFKRSIPSEISLTNRHLLTCMGMDPMSPLKQLNKLKSLGST
jgi:hypothetical protein